jgi:hypothetical protein
MAQALPSNVVASGARADPFSDPVLSGNVYCDGRLCEVIHKLVAPSWERFRHRTSEEPESYLWLMRYAKGGEHLKIRFHGSAASAPLLRRLLDEEKSRYFASLPPAAPEARRHSRPSATPIDREDVGVTDHPDRSLLWTEYRRSPVSLGYEPYLEDDRYLVLLTRCLGRGSEILLARLKSGADGRSPHAIRQTLLLHGLIAGLSDLALSPSDRALYLLYHRDTLLRSRRKGRGAPPGDPEETHPTLRQFAAEMERMEAAKDRLARTTVLYWNGSGRAWGNDFTSWRRAVQELAAYVSSVEGDKAYAIDPLAPRPGFPALFKALHGFANQAGVDPLNEAFAHHFLLVSSTPDSALLSTTR